MADTLGLIGIFVLAGIYFIIFHQIFDVFYFGFKGISGTIIGCVVAAIFTITLIVTYWKWVVGIAVVVGALWKLGQSKDDEEVAVVREEE